MPKRKWDIGAPAVEHNAPQHEQPEHDQAQNQRPRFSLEDAAGAAEPVFDPSKLAEIAASKISAMLQSQKVVMTGPSIAAHDDSALVVCWIKHRHLSF